jgi:uncharacterized protein
MSRNPFDPTFDQLPDSMPVFPLSGALLLPRGRLPLNIFEPRYLAMVQDALTGDRIIGMIQPQAGLPDGESGPSLFAIGCAGRITSFAETGDGRILLTLTGLCRFGIHQELPGRNGYRRIVPEWSPFRSDMLDSPATLLDREKLTPQLQIYLKQCGITVDWTVIAETPDELLVTSLAMVCPFQPREKQALLEAPGLPERASMLLALIEMAVHDVALYGETARH